MDKSPIYLTPRQIAESPEYPFTLSALRFMLFKRKENGLSSACRKIGRKLLINKEIFDKWIESKKE